MRRINTNEQIRIVRVLPGLAAEKGVIMPLDPGILENATVRQILDYVMAQPMTNDNARYARTVSDVMAMPEGYEIRVNGQHVQDNELVNQYYCAKNNNGRQYQELELRIAATDVGAGDLEKLL